MTLLRLHREPAQGKTHELRWVPLKPLECEYAAGQGCLCQHGTPNQLAAIDAAGHVWSMGKLCRYTPNLLKPAC